jgi:hypothetical protein
MKDRPVEDIHQQILRCAKDEFDALAMQVFRLQAKNNPLYAEYLRLLGIRPSEVSNLAKVPFLPIGFFKTHNLRTGDWQPEAVFSSSGTTGVTTSRHALRSRSFYESISLAGFEHFYGDVSDYCILALLPSYLERPSSSLVEMARFFIERSRRPQSGFFLDDLEKLADRLGHNAQHNIPTLLIGVSFALLDLAERFPMPLGNNTIIMETGGMKGRRKELIREELHAALCAAFKVPSVHSEYGMTELLSQGYSTGKGIFYPSPSMRVYTREINDPFALQAYGRVGVLNVVDLANVDTCSFIATDDLGTLGADGSFQLLGRLDNSDVRGCNLLYEPT